MRKKGKFEAANASGYQKAYEDTKTPLFRVYISSLVSLLLCCTMLAGTTMAWFAADVSSTNNVISTGKLEVDLLFNDGTQSYSMKAGNTRLLTENDTKWRPNMLVVKNLTVENKGTLAANYDFYFSRNTATLSEEDVDIAKFFTVYSRDSYSDLADSTQGIALTDITGDDTWHEVGTLAEILDDHKKVFTGSLQAASGTESRWQTHAIAIYMNANAGSGGEFGTSADFMGKNLHLDMELKAYQEDMPAVTSEMELRSILSHGGSAVLAENIEISENLSMDGGALDGNGKRIDASGTDESYDCAITTTGGVIRNLTVSKAHRAIGSGTSGNYLLTQDMILENVSIPDAVYALSVSNGGNHAVTVTNSTLNGWISVDGASLEFNNCTLGDGGNNGYQVIYENVTYNDCSFGGFHISAATTVTPGAVITLRNCTYGGQAVTADNFRTLFMRTGDEEYFNALSKCTVKVDGTTVSWD